MEEASGQMFAQRRTPVKWKYAFISIATTYLYIRFIAETITLTKL